MRALKYIKCTRRRARAAAALMNTTINNDERGGKPGAAAAGPLRGYAPAMPDLTKQPRRFPPPWTVEEKRQRD